MANSVIDDRDAFGVENLGICYDNASKSERDKTNGDEIELE